MAAAAARRDAAFGSAGHLLAEGVRPADDAVPRSVRLLHVRQAAGPARRRRTSRPTKCSRSRGGAPQLGCHEALFTLGEATGSAVSRGGRVARRGTATPRRSTTSPTSRGLVLDETGLLPHANAGALSQPELERLRAVSPSQGMMIETLAARLGDAGGPHHGAPDKTPERRLATLDAAGRAPRPVHDRDPRRHRRDARRTPRSARGDRGRRTAATATCRK